MEHKYNIELEGDLIDSLQLTAVLDEITESGTVCKIREIKVNEEKTGNSYVRLNISSGNKDSLDILKDKLVSYYKAKVVEIVTRTVEIQGHILDSLTLAKTLDIIAKNDGRCEIKDIKIGLDKSDFSYAKINISALNKPAMENILEKVKKQGAVEI